MAAEDLFDFAPNDSAEYKQDCQRFMPLRGAVMAWQVDPMRINHPPVHTAMAMRTCFEQMRMLELRHPNTQLASAARNWRAAMDNWPAILQPAPQQPAYVPDVPDNPPPQNVNMNMAAPAAEDSLEYAAAFNEVGGYFLFIRDLEHEPGLQRLSPDQFAEMERIYYRLNYLIHRFPHTPLHQSCSRVLWRIRLYGRAPPPREVEAHEAVDLVGKAAMAKAEEQDVIREQIRHALPRRDNGQLIKSADIPWDDLTHHPILRVSARRYLELDNDLKLLRHYRDELEEKGQFTHEANEPASQLAVVQHRHAHSLDPEQRARLEQREATLRLRLDPGHPLAPGNDRPPLNEPGEEKIDEPGDDEAAPGTLGHQLIGKKRKFGEGTRSRHRRILIK